MKSGPFRAPSSTAWFLSLWGAIAVAAEPGQWIFQDDFDGKLAEGWYFEREDSANWQISPLGLEVRVQPGNMWGPANNAKNVLARAIPAPTDAPIEISVTLSNRPTGQWEQANLVWFYDGGNMVKLGQELVTGRYSIVMGREEGDRARTVAIIPLDANAVELRLQAVNSRVRGQFRTPAWSDWRDVGQCDLPVKGDPHASLHFYNGPANELHWVRINRFGVRRLSAGGVDWPRVRIEEKVARATDNPRVASTAIALPGGFALFNSLEDLAAEPKPDYELSICRYREGAYGWHWDRRNSATGQPAVAGVGLGTDARGAMGTGGFRAVGLAGVNSLELEMDAVTWLENDHGDHNLVAVLPLKPSGRITIWFDWYGPASTVQSLNDGYRDYGFVPAPAGTGETQYRLSGFRGAPPRVNLKRFIEDAVRRGVAPESQLQGVWFGNEIWNGSRGGTLVTRMDLVLNGRRYVSVPAQVLEKKGSL